MRIDPMPPRVLLQHNFWASPALYHLSYRGSLSIVKQSIIYNIFYMYACRWQRKYSICHSACFDKPRPMSSWVFSWTLSLMRTIGMSSADRYRVWLEKERFKRFERCVAVYLHLPPQRKILTLLFGVILPSRCNDTMVTQDYSQRTPMKHRNSTVKTRRLFFGEFFRCLKSVTPGSTHTDLTPPLISKDHVSAQGVLVV